MQAYEYVGKNVAVDAAGLSIAKLAPADIVQKLVDTKLVQTGGTLSQLALPENCVKTMDIARIAMILKENDSTSFKSVIGPIIINASVWSGNTFTDLRRANHDAEVNALCFISFWLNSTEFNHACADLTFEFQRIGEGTKHITLTLEHLDWEEKKRNVMGISGWRRLQLYSDLCETMKSEGRLVDSGNSEAERMLMMLKEDSIDVTNIQVDTMKRYLALGRRVNDPSIKNILA